MAHNPSSDHARHLSSLTTLQLARAIADAVLRTSRQRHRDSVIDAPTQAVLDTLYRTGTGFTAETQDEDDDVLTRRDTLRRFAGQPAAASDTKGSAR